MMAGAGQFFGGRLFCGRDRSPAAGVPERGAGMKAEAGRADSLVFGSLPQADGQKAAHVLMSDDCKNQRITIC